MTDEAPQSPTDEQLDEHVLAAMRQLGDCQVSQHTICVPETLERLVQAARPDQDRWREHSRRIQESLLHLRNPIGH